MGEKVIIKQQTTYQRFFHTNHDDKPLEKRLDQSWNDELQIKLH